MKKINRNKVITICVCHFLALCVWGQIYLFLFFANYAIVYYELPTPNTIHTILQNRHIESTPSFREIENDPDDLTMENVTVDTIDPVQSKSVDAIQQNQIERDTIKSHKHSACEKKLVGYSCDYIDKENQTTLLLEARFPDSTSPREYLYIRGIFRSGASKSRQDLVESMDKFRHLNSIEIISTIRHFERDVLAQDQLSYNGRWDNIATYCLMVFMDTKYYLLSIIILSWVICLVRQIRKQE